MHNIPLIPGKRIKISANRQFVNDLLRHAEKVPALPMQRTMDLSDLIEARKDCRQRVCWPAIFIRAYALVAEKFPELRRSYMAFPRPYIYEHPVNIATVSVERVYENERCVFFSRIFRPERTRLAEIDRTICDLQRLPVESIPSFKLCREMGEANWLKRKFSWWGGLNVSGPYRASKFGTFGISVVASRGAASLYLLSPLTTALNYGVFRPDGTIDVRVTYDHRVMDGAIVAEALVALEDTLQTTLSRELHSLSKSQSNYFQDEEIPVS